MADITITKDAELRQEEPDTNFGSSETLFISEINGKRKNMVIDFDISSIPLASDIIDAKLTLHNLARATVDVSIFSLTKQWKEANVCWNLPWGTAGGDFSSAPQIDGTLQRVAISDFDLKPIIELWVKQNQPCYGILIRAKISGAQAQVVTKEHLNPSYTKPKLEVNFNPATPIQQIDAGQSEIEILPDSHFFLKQGAIAKRIFKRLSNTAKILISKNLNTQAKIVLETIIRFMNGSGFDLLVQAESQTRIRPFFEQAKAGL